MTTFTPPTEFPHECLTKRNSKVTLLAVDSNGQYAAFWHGVNGTMIAVIYRPENLRDIPKVTSTWHNVYPGGATGKTGGSRKAVDKYAEVHRIGVLRIDKVYGVTTCSLEAAT